tara:strand:+ start:177 stop:1832 length:1656 start_codon:yes stop_codon:yes gene_type:complete
MKEKEPKYNLLPRGSKILHDPLLNKGTNFSEDERDQLGLRGLLPPRILTLETQKDKILKNFNAKKNDLEKYIYMIALQDRNETLFYYTLISEIKNMMPIIYTPTVGRACQKFDHIFRRPRGLYISFKDLGKVETILKNWPFNQVEVIVVTDGERILGLGDLGANGMGIPIGKLSLYTACAGIDPSKCLPITLDVGTNNDNLLKNPFYLGLQKRRIAGRIYDDFLDEFMASVSKIFPNAVIQFEDFANSNAARLLKKYRGSYCMFNDDIQGTAAVTLSGLISSMKLTSQKLEDQKLLFYGSGTAGIGIGNLFSQALVDIGIPESDARKKCWFVDSKGLVVKSRDDLSLGKLLFAQDHKQVKNLLEIVNQIKPTILIGVSGKANSFDKKIISSMNSFNKRPIIFALSNPTSNSECTAKQVYKWTQGRGIFASGSPFEPVIIKEKKFIPSQGNNVYIFPGVGLGVLLAGVVKIPDSLFITAAKKLSDLTSQDELSKGLLYPSLNRIRSVSRSIAIEVYKKAMNDGIATKIIEGDIKEFVDKKMYSPNYKKYEDN